MKNYQLTIQYDGGRYKGWQRLGNNDNTIQGKLEQVLSEMVGEETELVGCSRTDAGVHAISQIANFKTHINLSEDEIKAYFNQYLPKDISVTMVNLVPDHFHSRYLAKEKTYLYKIWNKEYSNPFMRKYSMHVPEPLSLQHMKKASSLFIGQHDFTSYSNAKSKKKSMVREVYSVDLWEEDGFIMIRIKGNGFLYNMVRKIVGTLIDVGRGTIDAAKIPGILQSKQRSQTGIMAEACGLYLEHIRYD